MEYSKTMQAVRQQGMRRKLASEISALVRGLDVLDRRERIRRADGVRVAQMLVDLDAIRRRLPAVEALAAKGDSQARFLVSEVPVMEAEVGTRLRRYLTEVGEPEIGKLGPTAWARKLLREEEKRKAAAGTRRAKTRPGTRPAKATMGTCKRCGKHGRLNEKRLCGNCQIEANTGNTTVHPLDRVAHGLCDACGRPRGPGRSKSMYCARCEKIIRRR